jgi:hypothetical protein
MSAPVLALLLAGLAGLADPPPAAPLPATPPPPAAPAPGQPPAIAPPAISPPDSWQPRDTGTLRVLNKLDSTVEPVTLKVGQTVHLQSLSITLQACDVRPADLPADATAHLQVADSRDGQPGFDGWILQNEPAVNMLEHPVYDIQLAGCG